MDVVRAAIAADLGPLCTRLDIEVESQTADHLVTGTAVAHFENPLPGGPSTVMRYPVVAQGRGFTCGYPADAITSEDYATGNFGGFTAVGSPSRDNTEHVLFVHFDSGYVGYLDLDPSYFA